MTAPYSWFSMTMTKTWEKDGTAAGGTGGGAAAVAAGLFVAAAGVAVGVELGVGVGVGVAWATGLEVAAWSSPARPDPVADGEVAIVDLAGVCPSTIAVGTAITAAAPMPMMAVRRPRNLMTRLTRSGSPSCGLHVA